MSGSKCTWRTVGLGERDVPDDGLIDRDAIDYALRGWEQYALGLSRREIAAAVHIGTRKDMSAVAIARALLLHPRQITQFRAEPEPVEDFTCPDDLADLEPDLAAA